MPCPITGCSLCTWSSYSSSMKRHAVIPTVVNFYEWKRSPEDENLSVICHKHPLFSCLVGAFPYTVVKQVVPKCFRFLLYIYSFSSPHVCVQIKLITKKLNNKYKQTGKRCWVFSRSWIMDRWMNIWKQQQNIYRVMNTEEGKTLNKQCAWNVWEVWFLGHPSVFFFISCLFFFFIHPPSLSICFSRPSLFLLGSSVWLFIGNDSHCGRAPLRLRSPPQHCAILPPPSVPFTMHYS